MMYNGEVNNVLNVAIIPKDIYTKSNVELHGPPTKAKVESGVREEQVSSADRSHPPCALCQN
jgi:hypothetical protein